MSPPKRPAVPTRPSQPLASWRVVAPFALVMALLAGLGVASVDILSSVRAYVAGESRWSKGQRDAGLWLREYARTGDELAYRRFEAALQVPLADGRARVAMEQAEPDEAAARRGLLDGGNHPDDIGGLIRLYRLFGRMDFMAQTIAIWAAGDEGIAALRALAAEAHAAGPSIDPERRRLLAERIDAANDRLDRLEQAFSARLGEASRMAGRVLTGVTLLLASVLATMVVLFARTALRRLAASEAAARDSAARWALATEAAEIGVFEWNLASNEIRLDRRSLALYGLGEGLERLDGERLLERVHADDRETMRSAARESRSDDGGWAMRYRVMLADGSVRHVAAHGRRSGEQLVGVTRDVTHEVLAEQLRLDKESAERASAAKSEFLSRASHELRTPLNAILGFAQMMQTDARNPLPALHLQRLKHVMQGGNYLLKLVNDLLDLGGIEQGVVPIVMADVDLGDVLRDSIDLLEPMRLARSVLIDNRVPPGRAWVRADAVRLEQVLVNLLGNAIKYNRAGGSVMVSAQVDGEGWTVEVRDTGIGMTPQQTAQLFQPFNRLGAEYSGIEGAGLGLVVSQQLLRRCGGDIEVHSDAGVGTCVRVRLQRADTDRAASKADPASPASVDAARPAAARAASQNQA